MPGLSCYWLKAPSVPGGGEHQTVPGSDTLDQYLDEEHRDRDEFGPIEGDGYRAKLFLTRSLPHEVPWARFLRQGFGEEVHTPQASGAAALVVFEIDYSQSQHYFAFTFGFGGRHVLRRSTWQTGSGLRAALNLIYPRTLEQDAGRLTALDSKSRGSRMMRARRQASQATDFESFDLDRFRDLVGGATGKPADADTWGSRITGADAMYLSVDIGFDDLPRLCKRLIEAHAQTDYKERFPWLDDVQPIADHDRTEELEQRVTEDLLAGRVQNLTLIPPEIVDWSHVDGFTFHYDRGTVHPDLRLDDYLRGVKRVDLNVETLKHRNIFAVDGDRTVTHKWSVWRCIQAQYSEDGNTVVLDEGEFVEVSANYMAELDAEIQSIREPAVVLPPAHDPSIRETEYNGQLTRALPDSVLLHEHLVLCEGRGRIELCDVLTAGHELVHIKRELGSSDLSHLFAQGRVSAFLLQDNPAFRRLAQEKVDEVSGNSERFRFVDTRRSHPSDFIVVYGVVAPWHGRSLALSLPFFSKVNLRSTARDLQRRGFKVAFAQISLESDRADWTAKSPGRDRPRLVVHRRLAGSADAGRYPSPQAPAGVRRRGPRRTAAVEHPASPTR